MEDFTDGEADPTKFSAIDKEGKTPGKLWKEETYSNGIHLLKDQWLWLKDEKIRGDAKVEVKMHYEGEPDGFQVCLNGNRFEQLEKWDHNPTGYACRYGYWGALTAVTANNKGKPTDLGTSISISPLVNKDFSLTFQREEEKLILSIDDQEVQREPVLIPLRGDRLIDIGFRTWSDNLVIDSIRVYRFTLPMESSPTVAGDALVEIDENEEAIDKYITIANDYPTEEPGKVALIKALQLWYQMYLGKTPTDEQKQLLKRIDKAFKTPGRNISEDRRKRIETPLITLDLFGKGIQRSPRKISRHCPFGAECKNRSRLPSD